jgi:DNA-directed RNA polymerase specialized sigma24 family protein
MKGQNNTVTRKEAREIVELVRKGMTYREVGEIVGRSVSTVNHCVTAINLGLKTPVDYANLWVELQGYGSRSEYITLRRLVRNPGLSRFSNRKGETRQHKFERSVEEGGKFERRVEVTGRLEQVADTREIVPGSRKYLEIETLNYGLGRLKDRRPRDYQAVYYYFFLGETGEEISKRLKIGQAAVSLRIIAGLKYLKGVMDRAEGRGSKET